MEKENVEITRIARLFAEGKKDELRTVGMARLRTIQISMNDLMQENMSIRFLLTKAGILAAPPVQINIPAEIPPTPILKTSEMMSNEGNRHDRRAIIRQTALELAKGGMEDISVDDILKSLQSKGINLNAPRPGSIVGTVLNAMKEFHRLEMGRFKYIGRVVSLRPSDAIEEVEVKL